MPVLTEEQIKKYLADNKTEERGIFSLPEGVILTPSAKAYLTEKRIDIKKEIGKAEHMTHLRENILVEKDHPLIRLRGAIDSLKADIIEVQIYLKEQKEHGLFEELQEIIQFLQSIIRCEVGQSPLPEIKLLGLSVEELREHSHHTTKYYGVGHFVPSVEQGMVCAKLNRLRTRTRQVEITAIQAFKNRNGIMDRMDIIKAFNRMSSAFWIMMVRYLAVLTEVNPIVTVEASGRHVHISKKHLEQLFGEDNILTKAKDLSQPGQFVSTQRITLCGPKGCIENVVILGPTRNETQVEISKTDCLILGIKAPVRLSGDLDNTPGILLKNREKEIQLERGTIVAKRHLHITPEDGQKWKLKDKEVVSAQISGNRPVIFEDVEVRMSKEFATTLHVDYDEANACGYEVGMKARLIKGIAHE